MEVGHGLGIEVFTVGEMHAVLVDALQFKSGENLISHVPDCLVTHGDRHLVLSHDGELLEVNKASFALTKSQLRGVDVGNADNGTPIADGKAEILLRGQDNMIIHHPDGTTTEIGNMKADTRWDGIEYTSSGNEYLLYLEGATAQPYEIGEASHPKYLTYPLPRGNDGDWGTVLTIDTSSQHAAPACPPDGATGKEYVTMGVSLGNGALEDVAQVIIVGDEVWLSNCCKQAKGLWIKGNVGTDGSLTFPKEQYLKSVEGYDYYFYGAAKEGTKTTPCDLLLTYDAEHDKYFAQQDIIVTADKWEAGQLVIETVQNFILFPSGAAPDMITATPEGEVKVYSRSGQSFIRNMGGVFFGDQNDQDIAICFAPDKKTVYMLYPLSSFDYRYDQEKEELMELWVKGTIEADGKIHYPLYQWLDYEEYYSTGMRTAVFRLFEMPEGSTYELAPEYNEVTFAIDEETGVIRLDSFDGVENAGDYPTLIYGAAYSDNFQWAGYGDAGSVYTPKEEEEDGIGVLQKFENGQTPACDLTGRIVKNNVRGVVLQGGRKILK